jgi:hypothetical protein
MAISTLTQVENAIKAHRAWAVEFDRLADAGEDAPAQAWCELEPGLLDALCHAAPVDLADAGRKASYFATICDGMHPERVRLMFASMVPAPLAIAA